MTKVAAAGGSRDLPEVQVEALERAQGAHISEARGVCLSTPRTSDPYRRLGPATSCAYCRRPAGLASEAIMAKKKTATAHTTRTAVPANVPPGIEYAFKLIDIDGYESAL